MRWPTGCGFSMDGGGGFAHFLVCRLVRGWGRPA